MTNVAIVGDRLVVEPLGWHRFWSLRRRVEVPLASVRSARVDPDRSMRPRGVRAPGSYWPGKITAGTYRWKGYTAFWDVSNRQRAVTIELAGAPFNELVVEVADPAATVAAIEAATARH